VLGSKSLNEALRFNSTWASSIAALVSTQTIVRKALAKALPSI